MIFKGAFLSLKMEGNTEESEGTGLASFLQFTTLSSYPSVPLFFYDFPFFIKPSIKMFRLNHFFESSFPYGGSHVTENLNKFVCFSSLMSLSVWLLGPARDPKRIKEKFSSLRTLAMQPLIYHTELLNRDITLTQYVAFLHQIIDSTCIKEVPAMLLSLSLTYKRAAFLTFHSFFFLKI